MDALSPRTFRPRKSSIRSRSEVDEHWWLPGISTPPNEMSQVEESHGSREEHLLHRRWSHLPHQAHRYLEGCWLTCEFKWWTLNSTPRPTLIPPPRWCGSSDLGKNQPAPRNRTNVANHLMSDYSVLHGVEHLHKLTTCTSICFDTETLQLDRIRKNWLLQLGSTARKTMWSYRFIPHGRRWLRRN